MKYKYILTVIAFIISITAMCQKQYETIMDDTHPGSKILKGIISKNIIKNDTAYKWYAENQKIYTHPDTAIVNTFLKNKDSISYIVFGGTWCEDTQFILPKFFVLQEKAGIPDDKITFFAVDRQKKTTGNISSAFNIINVPTIILT
jgi:thiol-disulfide isomerase/thioredoxin